MRIGFDMDGVICRFTPLQPEQWHQAEHYYDVLPLDKDTRNLWNNIVCARDTYIITSRSWPLAAQDIAQWLTRQKMHQPAGILCNSHIGRSAIEFKVPLIQALELDLYYDDTPSTLDALAHPACWLVHNNQLPDNVTSTRTKLHNWIQIYSTIEEYERTRN